MQKKCLEKKRLHKKLWIYNKHDSLISLNNLRRVDIPLKSIDRDQKKKKKKIEFNDEKEKIMTFFRINLIEKRKEKKKKTISNVFKTNKNLIK